MNAKHLKVIDKAVALIVEARGLLEGARDDEQDYFDNMPEGIQNSDNGAKAQEAVSELEEACSALGGVLTYLDIASE